MIDKLTKLIDLADEKIRGELGDYYIVSKDQLNMINNTIERLQEKVEWFESKMIQAYTDAEEERNMVLGEVEEGFDFPDDMLDELWKQVQNCDRSVVEKLIREAVRVTQDKIYKRIEKMYEWRPI